MIYGWQTFAITLTGVCRMLVKYPRWNFLRKLSVIICFHKIINLSLTMFWIRLWISLVISPFQTEQFALIDTEYFDQHCPYTECLCVPYLSQSRFIVLTNSYTTLSQGIAGVIEFRLFGGFRRRLFPVPVYNQQNWYQTKVKLNRGKNICQVFYSSDFTGTNSISRVSLRYLSYDLTLCINQTGQRRFTMKLRIIREGVPEVFPNVLQINWFQIKQEWWYIMLPKIHYGNFKFWS